MHGNLEILEQGVAFIASIIFALIPLHRSRVRTGWAVALFVIVGIVGVMVAGMKLLMLGGWIVPSSMTAGRIQQARVFLCGVAVGAIGALVLSSQLFGSTREQTNGTTAY
jgi:hypothetical protein